MNHEKKTVALALGSGGARGYAHIGVIQALEERGYDIGKISGCSMGAIVGGFYAAGKLPQYRDWVTSLGYIDVLKLVDFSLLSGGAIKLEKVYGVMGELLGEINIEDLNIPYTSVATDLKHDKEIWFQRGSLVEVAESESEKKAWLNTVMDRASEWLGKRTNEARKEADENLGKLETLTRMFEVMQSSLSRFKTAGYPPDLLIRIPTESCEMYEFYRAQEMVDLGYQIANDALDAFEHGHSSLYGERRC